MAAQHLPRDLVRPSSGYKALAQKKRTKEALFHTESTQVQHYEILLTEIQFIVRSYKIY